ncbi:MAG: DNA-processing protein DprA [Christensenellales bacterium]
MTYSDNDKALIMLSVEATLKKRIAAFESVEQPKELYDDYSLADKMIDAMRERGVVAVTIRSDLYPSALKDIYEPPLVLYCRGNLELLKSRSIAVVGTRKATRYGKDVTKLFVEAFVAKDICIVSGMARGIDSVAHRSALDCGGKTIAVVATGLDQVYPAENLSLAHEIIDKGLMISEYPLGTSAHAYRFPERNRIVSGLSESVLIPEAGLNSGSMITAECALEQGKDLYVVPGSIFAPQSQGTNLKIKELQGCMVTDPKDILGDGGKQQEKEQIQLSLEQHMILDMLDGEVHFTELLEKSKMGVASLSALLSEMEIYGLIRKISGNYYVKSPMV